MDEALVMLDPESTITLAQVVDELKRFYDGKSGGPGAIDVSESEVTLRWTDYVLQLTQSTSLHVLQESLELARHYAARHPARERIAKCHTRFELFGGDDPAMDHFNDYLFVGEAIERLGTVYRFESASEEFVN